MNKKLLAAAVVLMGAAAAQAQTDPNELRIYINPGHGSWTGNDRPVWVIGHEAYTSTGTDSTGFFESNTDLIKGFGVLEKLIEMGIPFDRTLNQTGELWEIGAAKDLSQNIVMSRVKNGPYDANNVKPSSRNDNPERWDYFELYNRSLWEISVEVDENEFDQFISIHSNAAGSGAQGSHHNNVNYHLFMYRGRNGQENEAVEGSYAICETTSKFSFANEHAQWSESKVYINGDVDFMGHGSGSTHSVTGAFGYLGVLKHWAPGYLVEGFFHTYTPSTHRAMNFDVDLIEGYQYARGVAEWFELEQRDATGEIYGIVRDAHSSFTYPKLYIPRAGSEDVLAAINDCKVLLHKDGQVIKEYTTDKYHNGAFVFIGLEPGMYQVTFEHPGYLAVDPVDVEVVAGRTVYPKVYLTDVYYYGRPGEELNYPNILPAEYKLAEKYDMIHAYDVELPQLAGKTVKRMIWNKGLVYILAHDAEGTATILVADAHTGIVYANVNTAGCEGTVQALSDIQVTGAGVLVACCKSKNQTDDKSVQSGDTRGNFNLYVWENNADGYPTGTPKLWYTTQYSAEFTRGYIGDSFVFRGNLDEGEVLVSAVDIRSAAAMRTISFQVADNAVTGEPTTYRPGTLTANDYVDQDFRMVISPMNRHQYFITGPSEKFGMREYDFEHTTSLAAIGETPKGLGYNTTGAGFFRYGDDSAMIFGTPGSDASKVTLYNISMGLSNATEVTLNGIKLPAANRVFTTGYALADTDGDFSVMVLCDNKLSRYTTLEADGVYDIAADSDLNAPVKFYDLNGRQVEGSLQPGIYVRLQGTTATKVVVK